jgi:cell division protein FtsI (penicillin-binding protein 3)
MTVTDILTKSSNVGTIKIAQALGKQRLYDYLRDFGFGRRTALGFPQEANGSLLKPADWSGTSIGTIPIGHGVAVTAMQMLYAYNAIANDGVYVPPKVVDTIIDADGQKHDAPVSEKPHRVISAATAAKMRGMLANVVRSGTGRAADIAGYDVAGKTGTARKPQAGGSYRGPDGQVHHVATFAGFMPADDPKLSIIVVLDEPRQVYAATTAAPAFAELGRNALRLEHVPPPAPVTGGPTVSVEPPRVRAQAAQPPATQPTTTTTTSPANAPTRRAAQNPTMDPAALAPSTTRPSALRLQLLPRRSG